MTNQTLLTIGAVVSLGTFLGMFWLVLYWFDARKKNKEVKEDEI